MRSRSSSRNSFDAQSFKSIFAPRKTEITLTSSKRFLIILRAFVTFRDAMLGREVLDTPRPLGKPALAKFFMGALDETYNALLKLAGSEKSGSEDILSYTKKIFFDTLRSINARINCIEKCVYREDLHFVRGVYALFIDILGCDSGEISTAVLHLLATSAMDKKVLMEEFSIYFLAYSVESPDERWTPLDTDELGAPELDAPKTPQSWETVSLNSKDVTFNLTACLKKVYYDLSIRLGYHIVAKLYAEKRARASAMAFFGRLDQFDEDQPTEHVANPVYTLMSELLRLMLQSSAQQFMLTARLSQTFFGLFLPKEREAMCNDLGLVMAEARAHPPILPMVKI